MFSSRHAKKSPLMQTQTMLDMFVSNDLVEMGETYHVSSLTVRDGHQIAQPLFDEPETWDGTGKTLTFQSRTPLHKINETERVELPLLVLVTKEELHMLVENQDVKRNEESKGVWSKTGELSDIDKLKEQDAKNAKDDLTQDDLKKQEQDAANDDKDDSALAETLNDVDNVERMYPIEPSVDILKELQDMEEGVQSYILLVEEFLPPVTELELDGFRAEIARHDALLDDALKNEAVHMALAPPRDMHGDYVWANTTALSMADKVDVDASGSITLQEFLLWVAPEKRKVQDADMMQWELTKKEAKFIKNLHRKAEKETGRPLTDEELFKFMDKDGSGTVDLHELGAKHMTSKQDFMRAKASHEKATSVVRYQRALALKELRRNVDNIKGAREAWEAIIAKKKSRLATMGAEALTEDTTDEVEKSLGLGGTKEEDAAAILIQSSWKAKKLTKEHDTSSKRKGQEFAKFRKECARYDKYGVIKTLEDSGKLKSGDPDARQMLRREFDQDPSLPQGMVKERLASSKEVRFALTRLHDHGRKDPTLPDFRDITGAQLVSEYWERMELEEELRHEVQLRNEHRTVHLSHEVTHIRHEMSKILSKLPLFAGVVREMESRFGSSVTVAFIFMQWLIRLNLYLVMVWIALVIVPWLYGYDPDVFMDNVCGVRKDTFGQEYCQGEKENGITVAVLNCPTDKASQLASRFVTVSDEGLDIMGDWCCNKEAKPKINPRAEAARISQGEYSCTLVTLTGNTFLRFMESGPLYVNGFDEDVSGVKNYSFIYLFAIIATNVFSGYMIVTSIGRALSGKAESTKTHQEAAAMNRPYCTAMMSSFDHSITDMNTLVFMQGAFDKRIREQIETTHVALVAKAKDNSWKNKLWELTRNTFSQSLFISIFVATAMAITSLSPKEGQGGFNLKPWWQPEYAYKCVMFTPDLTTSEGKVERTFCREKTGEVTSLEASIYLAAVKTLGAQIEGQLTELTSGHDGYSMLRKGYMRMWYLNQFNVFSVFGQMMKTKTTYKLQSAQANEVEAKFKSGDKGGSKATGKEALKAEEDAADTASLTGSLGSVTDSVVSSDLTFCSAVETHFATDTNLRGCGKFNLSDVKGSKVAEKLNNLNKLPVICTGVDVVPIRGMAYRNVTNTTAGGAGSNETKFYKKLVAIADISVGKKCEGQRSNLKGKCVETELAQLLMRVMVMDVVAYVFLNIGLWVGNKKIMGKQPHFTPRITGAMCIRSNYMQSLSWVASTLSPFAPIVGFLCICAQIKITSTFFKSTYLPPLHPWGSKKSNDFMKNFLLLSFLLSVVPTGIYLSSYATCGPFKGSIVSSAFTRDFLQDGSKLGEYVGMAIHYLTSPPLLTLMSAVLWIQLYFTNKTKARLEKQFKLAEKMLEAERKTARAMFGQRAADMQKAEAARIRQEEKEEEERRKNLSQKEQKELAKKDVEEKAAAEKAKKEKQAAQAEAARIEAEEMEDFEASHADEFDVNSPTPEDMGSDDEGGFSEKAK